MTYLLDTNVVSEVIKPNPSPSVSLFVDAAEGRLHISVITLAEIGFGIGLHVGNVMFGNVGLTDRLTFSAFGSAVNEVQRLQMLTKKYPHRLIASKDFATYTGGGWVTLGKEKLAGVKQKLTVLHPDVSDIDLSDEDGFEVTYDGMSDAEQLMLLIRGGGQSMIEVNGGKKLQ